MRSEITYIFGDDGIHQKRINSNSYYDWDDIRSIYEYRDMYLLYVSKYNAIILPKRFFETENKRDLFKKVVCDNVATQKVKWL